MQTHLTVSLARPAGQRHKQDGVVAVYHMSVKTFSRSRGQSATAAIAYRAGEKVVDHRTGEIHDYTRRTGVQFAQLVGVYGVSREELWNRVEAAEKRKNSTVAREWEVSLPWELSTEQRQVLALEFANEIHQRHGVAVDCCIHSPRDKNSLNYHAHILTSTRRLNGVNGEEFGEKARELDDKKSGEVQRWRARWEALCNDHLQRARKTARIDHRSYQDQGKEIAPQPKLGAAAAMERRGVETRQGHKFRCIQKLNTEIADMNQQIQREKKKQREEGVEMESSSACLAGPPSGWQQQEPEPADYWGIVQKLDPLAQVEDLGRGAHRVTFSDGCELLDKGNRMQVQRAANHRQAAQHMIALGREKGWNSIQFWGPDAWRRTAIAEAVKLGMPLAVDAKDKAWLAQCQAQLQQRADGIVGKVVQPAQPAAEPAQGVEQAPPAADIPQQENAQQTQADEADSDQQPEPDAKHEARELLHDIRQGREALQKIRQEAAQLLQQAEQEEDSQTPR